MVVVDGERFVPTIADEHGPTFDVLVAEIVDWRLSPPLSGRADVARLRVGQAEGRPLLWLDRDRSPGLPIGEARFMADGHEYTGRFVK